MLSAETQERSLPKKSRRSIGLWLRFRIVILLTLASFNKIVFYMSLNVAEAQRTILIPNISVEPNSEFVFYIIKEGIFHSFPSTKFDDDGDDDIAGISRCDVHGLIFPAVNGRRLRNSKRRTPEMLDETKCSTRGEVGKEEEKGKEYPALLEEHCCISAIGVKLVANLAAYDGNAAV
ncbi:hypothetical protein E2P81_ATG07087 [Venturia nashicola]|uniref:Uncharacterized protein n=1 Tax=Venturia nashicola TaxID=86259 RepID=A0A4Z1NML4_9PEZI|nr:hypothetical protein E6O75_ATG07253 [Venturia nashicola]TLD19470.1 hypothetical protein E2P81_ATG07087 [Venturia nashicola]